MEEEEEVAVEVVHRVVVVVPGRVTVPIRMDIVRIKGLFEHLLNWIRWGVVYLWINYLNVLRECNAMQCNVMFWVILLRCRNDLRFEIYFCVSKALMVQLIG